MDQSENLKLEHEVKPLFLRNSAAIILFMAAFYMEFVAEERPSVLIQGDRVIVWQEK
jgi:hypothetical protein